MNTFLALVTFVGVVFVVLLAAAAARRLARGKVSFGDDRPLAFGSLTVPLAYMFCISRSSYAKLEKELKQAGNYAPHALEQFLAIRNVLVAGWIVFVTFAVFSASRSDGAPLALFIGGTAVLAVLFALPRLMLQSKASRRVRQIQTQLPDALDMMSMCLSGGLPLQQAMLRVSSELETSHPQLAQELAIVQHQADTHSLSHALQQFAERIDADELRSLSALVTQTERLGTNVASALSDYADSIRRAFRQRAEEQGNKTSVKMLLPISLCLAPPVYILLLAPALLELREFVSRETRPGGALSQASENVGQFQQIQGDTDRPGR